MLAFEKNGFQKGFFSRSHSYVRNENAANRQTPLRWQVTGLTLSAKDGYFNVVVQKELAVRGGFTLVEIMIVVAIVGMLAVIATPYYVRARERSQMQACINNLRQIDNAKDRYALETNLTDGSPVTWLDIVPFFLQPFGGCPAGGNYVVNPVSTEPECTLGAPHTI